jgi:site-specific DNA recombinase
MQSHWINRAAYYRCRFPEEYALANKVTHPANVYLREDRIVPRLDEWLSKLFEPGHLAQTLDALAAAQRAPSHEDAVLSEARRQVAECDRKLARHRAALEAGADPAVVTAWIREVQAARAEAEAQLRTLGHARPRVLDREELAEMTRAIGDMVRVLTDADPARKARIYAGLGLRLTYHPERKKVLVGQASAQGIGEQFVSEGGLEPLAYLLQPPNDAWLDVRDSAEGSSARSPTHRPLSPRPHPRQKRLPASR